jgi:hypothetical protein
MSTEKQQGKKTIITSKKTDTPLKKEKVKATTTSRLRVPIKQSLELLYGWSQYKVMLIGIGLIAIGMVLMLGGHMPSPDVWDESLI